MIKRIILFLIIIFVCFFVYRMIDQNSADGILSDIKNMDIAFWKPKDIQLNTLGDASTGNIVNIDSSVDKVLGQVKPTASATGNTTTITTTTTTSSSDTVTTKPTNDWTSVSIKASNTWNNISDQGSSTDSGSNSVSSVTVSGDQTIITTTTVVKTPTQSADPAVDSSVSSSSSISDQDLLEYMAQEHDGSR